MEYSPKIRRSKSSLDKVSPYLTTANTLPHIIDCFKCGTDLTGKKEGTDYHKIRYNYCIACINPQKNISRTASIRNSLDNMTDSIKEKIKPDSVRPKPKSKASPLVRSKTDLNSSKSGIGQTVITFLSNRFTKR